MTSSSHWSSMRERGSLLGLKIIFAFYKCGGRYLAVVLLYPIIFYFLLTDKVTRSASQDYLEKMYRLGYLKQKPSFWLSFQHFLSMGFAALDKVDVWLGNIDIDSINYVNYNLFEELLFRKQGALIVGSHIGNLEICRALSSKKTDAQFNVLVFTEHAQKFNDFINGLNDQAKVNLIEVSEMGPDLAILLQEKIDQGEYVVIAGDRTSTTVAGRVIYNDFLGKKAPFSQGPFILAGILQCPVLMMFCLKTKSAEKQQYDLIFEQLSTGVQWNRKTRDSELNKLVAIYAKTLEKYCSKYPLQWFNFFNFWQRDNLSRGTVSPNANSSNK
ncbi:acyltransferase [Colwellia sp. RSH04]|uniref:LpxL/LpxP family acyltransferase n=1 Tax=Colwellia sp. RSH04 TaxID=2305464 RepID=UPI000E5690BC|nr:acyltransferase [Colwellia sp. RSH04]RHW75792.1 acyltransferase [Colwellia sp. RSH04]